MKIDYKVVATTVMVFYAMLYLFSLKNNMVFGRDTIQYLNMAYKVQHLEWPLSQRWMPLYGVIIGMVSWFYREYTYCSHYCKSTYYIINTMGNQLMSKRMVSA
jgi:hypothetical protein